jgi:hypothetical protein
VIASRLDAGKGDHGLFTTVARQVSIDHVTHSDVEPVEF